MARTKKNRVTPFQKGIVATLSILSALPLAMFVIDSLGYQIENKDLWKTMLIIALPSLLSYLVGGNMRSQRNE